MKNKKLAIILQKLPLAVVFACLFCLCAGNALAQIGSYTIVCGHTGRGQVVECNTGTHRCLKCRNKRGWFVAKTVYYTFSCVSRSSDVPSNCEVSNVGGVYGDVDLKIFGASVNKFHVEGKQCITKNLMSMYSSTCYSCEIVEILASAFIRAAAKAYDVSKEAGNAILVVGMILWIGIFVLKNISSFSTVEPMKMLQDLMLQLFKILVAFVILNSGIPTILHYTMEPIMLAGTDFGNTILNANLSVNREATEALQAELQQELQERDAAIQAANGGRND